MFGRVGEIKLVESGGTGLVYVEFDVAAVAVVAVVAGTTVVRVVGVIVVFEVVLL